MLNQYTILTANILPNMDEINNNIQRLSNCIIRTFITMELRGLILKYCDESRIATHISTVMYPIL